MNVEAWKYGPVFQGIYHSFKSSNPHEIKTQENVIFSTAPFSNQEIIIIDYVQDNYSKLSAWQLSDLTHSEGTPWFNARQEMKKNGENFVMGYTIKNEDIKKYYKDFIKRLEKENEKQQNT